MTSNHGHPNSGTLAQKRTQPRQFQGLESTTLGAMLSVLCKLRICHFNGLHCIHCTFVWLERCIALFLEPKATYLEVICNSDVNSPEVHLVPSLRVFLSVHFYLSCQDYHLGQRVRSVRVLHLVQGLHLGQGNLRIYRVQIATIQAGSDVKQSHCFPLLISFSGDGLEHISMFFKF